MISFSFSGGSVTIFTDRRRGRAMLRKGFLFKAERERQRLPPDRRPRDVLRGIDRPSFVAKVCDRSRSIGADG